MRFPRTAWGAWMLLIGSMASLLAFAQTPSTEPGKIAEPGRGAQGQAVHQEVLKRTFPQDSLSRRIGRGLSKETGPAAPANIRITEEGIRVPPCFEESRDGLACK